MNMLRRFINGFVDILYPKTCIACRKKLRDYSTDNFICIKCWNSIKRNLPPFCYSCGRHLEIKGFTKNICPGCIKRPVYFDRAFSPCIYEGVIKELIHAFKYRNKDYLGLPLSQLMTEFIKEYNIPMDYLDFIVPIPLHSARLREREFNQAQILGKYIAREFNKELLADSLIRHKPTKTQADLKISERILNVKGSFAVKNFDKIKGRNILLVDDVLTTCATSSEAALALKKAGANIVFVLTLAN